MSEKIIEKYKLEIYIHDENTLTEVFKLIDEYADKNNKFFYILKGEFGLVNVTHVHTQIDNLK